MLSCKMMQTSILILIAVLLFSTVLSESVTSPRACLFDLECPPTSFCNKTYYPQLPRCVRRLPKNAICNRVGLSECKKGLTCTFDRSIRKHDPVCRPRAPRGRTCRYDSLRPCQGSLICDTNTSTCQPLKAGIAGSPCSSNRDCQQDNGFYCQTRRGVCAPKRGPGAECERRSDSFECLGFCANRFVKGICLAARKEGDLCTESYQCENPFFDRRGPRADKLFCNIPKGVVGRCVRLSRLLTRLGAKCDPHNDRCDVRRALSCRPTRSGRHVCQHRVSRFTDEFRRFCEPNNRLSRCPWGEAKTECRLERDVPGKYMPIEPSPFFWCLRQSERVPRGGVCITEYAACTGGTECREVPGVQPETTEEYTRHPLQRVAFCVRIVQKGGSCGDVKNKFTTQCAKGLRCEKGKCMKSEKDKEPFDEAVTHGGLRSFCNDLPCAPGLVCEKGKFDSEKRCILPLKIVGRGETCIDRAFERRRCKSGLVCALRKDGTNVLRCRRPRKAGDYCLESECDKGLACPELWNRNREQEQRRCYDPTTTLSIGQTCDPNASASQPRCVTNKRWSKLYPHETILEPMRCVKKGDRFACRVIVGLFEICDEKRDITCDNGFKCGRFSICVPEGEA